MNRVGLGRVSSVNLSNGGVPKRSVEEAFLTLEGFQGDRQRDEAHHGGPERAALLFSEERIRALAREGHPIQAGLIGENLTLSGLDWGLLVPGATIVVGEAELQVTRFAAPCSKIAFAFAGGDFRRVSEEVHPGWSRVCTRVLRAGRIRRGDPAFVRANVAGLTPDEQQGSV